MDKVNLAASKRSDDASVVSAIARWWSTGSSQGGKGIKKGLHAWRSAFPYVATLVSLGVTKVGRKVAHALMQGLISLRLVPKFQAVTACIWRRRVWGRNNGLTGCSVPRLSTRPEAAD